MAAMSMFLIISTAWAVIALVLLIVAWWMVRVGRIMLHRNIMILLTAGAWTFVINYIFVQRYSGDLGSFPSEYVPWMALHGSLGLVPLIGATCLVVSQIDVEPEQVQHPFQSAPQGIWPHVHCGLVSYPSWRQIQCNLPALISDAERSCFAHPIFRAPFVVIEDAGYTKSSKWRIRVRRRVRHPRVRVPPWRAGRRPAPPVPRHI